MTIVDRILHFLRRHGEPKLTREIADGCNLTMEQASTTLRYLKRCGLVEPFYKKFSFASGHPKGVDQAWSITQRGMN